MNDVIEPTAEQHVFYSSKPRLVHMAINIAIAPVLLYLLGAWAWPPVLQHYIVFAITGLMAVNYARQRWNEPRLVLDANGLLCGKFYAADNIYKAEPSLRSVTLTLLTGGQVKNKVVSLGWASKEDCQTIQQLLAARFQREIPDKLSP
ncbi:MAG: hypothetical protein OEV07_17380 [Gammaproteobacteria bacterium]|nr:hypothetical protein [Gammaproteobacteria bacterium]